MSLDFDVSQPAEEPVTIKTKEGVKNYTLREATGAAARTYRRASLAGSELTFNDNDDTRTVKRLDGVSGAESLLVSLCLFDEAGKSVPQAVVESWPAKVQRALFDRAKEMGGLDEKDDVASLRKQRAKLDARLAKLEGNAGATQTSADGSGSLASSDSTPSP